MGKSGSEIICVGSLVPNSEIQLQEWDSAVDLKVVIVTIK